MEWIGHQLATWIGAETGTDVDRDLRVRAIEQRVDVLEARLEHMERGDEERRSDGHL